MLEIAYLSADRLKIALKQQHGSRRGKYVVEFFNHPSRFLGTMLVGNNIALVIFGNLMEESLMPQLKAIMPSFLTGEFGLLLSITLISTLIVLLFGEFIPKALFRLFATNLLFLFTYVHYGLQWLLAPLVWLMVKASEWLLQKIFRMKITPDEQVFTRVDLVNFIERYKAQTLDTEMFEKAIALNNIGVKDCMIPRSEIKSISINANIKDLTQAFIDAKVSRLIVHNGDLDNILGYVHHLQLLSYPQSIAEILRPNIPKFTIDMPAMDTMNLFMKERITIGYVSNKNNRTLGLIALEDILEQVFGNIEDEHD